MEIRFIKVNPVQNMTVLVESSHPRQVYPEIAACIMAYENVFAEQVGFIETPENKIAWAALQMANGEYCSNATMALAAVMAWKQKLKPGDRLTVPLEASGKNGLSMCDVQAKKPGFLCKMEIPLPLDIQNRRIPCGSGVFPATIVRYPGVVHAVIEACGNNDATRRMAQHLIRSGQLVGREKDVIGVLPYTKNTYELTPLVYVPGCKRAVWEKGCGLGAASVAACLAWENQESLCVKISQPGGGIRVWAELEDNKICHLAIALNIFISAFGTALVYPETES